MDASNVDYPWALEREIVLSRVFAAPRDLLWKAWTEKDQISQWFGPKGFVTTTHEMDARVGGAWRFEMRAADGTCYPNRVVYLDVTQPERLVYDHDSDEKDDPRKFRVIVTFEEQHDKKTVVTMRQLHPTKEHRDAGIAFGGVEFGYQTLDKLQEHLGRT